MSTDHAHAVQVAVPVPLRRTFDYLSDQPLAAGVRVRVPFGRRSLTGVVTSSQPPAGGHTLKPIIELLDSDNAFGEALFETLCWAARYYHHPLGEVLHTALPVNLRGDRPQYDPTRTRRFDLATDTGPEQIDALQRRAPLQYAICSFLLRQGGATEMDFRNRFPQGRDALRRLQDKALVTVSTCSTLPGPAATFGENRVQLSKAQRHAADHIRTHLGEFRTFLLHGITGSGKTEVYLDVAEHAIGEGKQVLFLVPEISLTPQLVARIRARFGESVCEIHSGLGKEQRYRSWWLAANGHVSVVLGTRSAVFTPLKRPGLILVDEEHDASYKQQDGFRYHARDLAIKRGSVEQVPVVLGSATPSMESLHNAESGRHGLLSLGDRIGVATLPPVRTVDLRHYQPREGISLPLQQAIGERLDRNEQSIIFVNRRGFAPLVQCYHCGWQARCDRCDAFLTYHQPRQQFRCHHCGSTARSLDSCAGCGEGLHLAGAGTQRIEQYLRKCFPDARIARLDRDEITTRDRLEQELDAIQLGDTDIIVGTQLITKGHDFSRVTLVGVVNSDQGLYSGDFRAPEHLFQQLVQVSGRAGRAQAPGEVLIQTAHPENVHLSYICHHDFDGFARTCLDERRLGTFPPFSHIALWRAESTAVSGGLTFLHHLAHIGNTLLEHGDFGDTRIMDAVPSPMEKLAGRFRAQLMVRARSRGNLHRLLGQWVARAEQDPRSRTVRWSLDVDPVDMF